MSGTIQECPFCGGEYRENLYDIDDYTVRGGWCRNCDRVITTCPQEAYDDPNFDVDSASYALALQIRKTETKYRITDIEKHNFVFTTKPIEGCVSCSSCKHGCRLIIAGDDAGGNCMVRGRNGYLEAMRSGDCNEYVPLDRWFGMGSECRYCHWSFPENGKATCYYHCKPLADISDYDRGHCNDYLFGQYQTIDRIGYETCPECDRSAAKLKYRTRLYCPFCGYKEKMERVKG